jgi:hypothetical protein
MTKEQQDNVLEAVTEAVLTCLVLTQTLTAMQLTTTANLVRRDVARRILITMPNAIPSHNGDTE